MTRTTLRFDVRAPEAAPVSTSEIVQATLAMASWADTHGFDGVSLSEHHGAEDGYLPSPVPMAAAVAARSKRLRISLSALLLPMYDPIKLAEDLILVDHISEGRVVTTAGTGYRLTEFEMFAVEHGQRFKILEEYVGVLLRAFSGEAFEWRGRQVRVTPASYTDPHPPLLMGGQSKTAARRAAHFGLPYQPANNDDEMNALYISECEANGHEPLLFPPGTGEMIWVAEDPERAWSQLGPYLLHDALTYAGWQPSWQQGSAMQSHATTLAEMEAEGLYKILTPDACVDYAEGLGSHGNLLLYPFCGGIPPDLAWQAVELFDAKVRPRLSAAAR